MPCLRWVAREKWGLDCRALAAIEAEISKGVERESKGTAARQDEAWITGGSCPIVHDPQNNSPNRVGPLWRSRVQRESNFRIKGSAKDLHDGKRQCGRPPEKTSLNDGRGQIARRTIKPFAAASKRH